MVHGPITGADRRTSATGPPIGSLGVRALVVRPPNAWCSIWTIRFGAVCWVTMARGGETWRRLSRQRVQGFSGRAAGVAATWILARLASKNDEQTVLDMLDRIQKCCCGGSFRRGLRELGPKPENLRRIAEQLNIGLDSLVFIDDNPVEARRRSSRTADGSSRRVARRAARVFGRPQRNGGTRSPRLSAEDRRAPNVPKRIGSANRRHEQAGNVEDFLHSLRMVARSDAATPKRSNAMHQLVQKTNQFNLTTRRHALDDLCKMIESPDAEVAWLRLRDRFGDSGLVCVGILEVGCGVLGHRHAVDELSGDGTTRRRCVFVIFGRIGRANAGARRLRGSFGRRPRTRRCKLLSRSRFYAARRKRTGRMYEADLTSGHLPGRRDRSCRGTHQGDCECLVPSRREPVRSWPKSLESAGEQVTRETSHETVEGWDSLNLLNVLMSIEAEFDVTVSPEEAAEFVWSKESWRSFVPRA